MKEYINASALENLTLGKTTTYKSAYDASLLQGVPRSLNRDGLDIVQSELPFFGEDVWYGYEVSWLNPKGKPVVAIAEFRVPCISENIIESKSFKLYLNSYNQTKFNSQDEVIKRLVDDLSFIAKAPVRVSLFQVDDCQALIVNQGSHECIDDIDVSIDSYELNPSLLSLTSNKDKVTKKLVSHLLKSNCLITNQPDWASIYIEYSGCEIDEASLLKYFISFREHNEFHEQCVERIFTDLMKHCQPEELTVFARYTRRGGLDINPYRSTHDSRAPNCRNFRQ